MKKRVEKEKKKLSRTTKIILYVVLGVAIILLLFNLGKPVVRDKGFLEGVLRSIGILQSSEGVGGSCDYVTGCDDGKGCTDNVCNSEGKCEYPNKPDGTSCKLSDGKDGFCKAGTCAEKTCSSVYGSDYIQCPKGSSDYANCCKNTLEECCHKDKRGKPACCSTAKNAKGERLYECSSYSDEIDGKKVYINYCKVLGCALPKSQKCSTLWTSICCLPAPQESCGAERSGANTPFCGHKNSCPNPKTEFKCYEDTKLGVLMCCTTGSETCEDSVLGGKKFCNAQKCASGVICQGIGDYSSLKICCNKGEACFHHSDGWPKCTKV